MNREVRVQGWSTAWSMTSEVTGQAWSMTSEVADRQAWSMTSEVADRQRWRIDGFCLNKTGRNVRIETFVPRNAGRTFFLK